MGESDDPVTPDGADGQPDSPPVPPDQGLNDDAGAPGPAQSGVGSTGPPAAADGAAAGSAGSAESPGGGQSPGGDDGEDGEEADERRRRLVWLLLLLLLVLVGGGIGTYVLDGGQDAAPGVRTPTETAAPTARPVAVGGVSLAADANTTLLRARGAVPGDEGVSRLALRNDGSAAGELAVANVTVDGGENGIAGPEAAVDDSPADGELAENLLVRLSMQYSDGTTVRVFGGDGFVPLADIGARNRTVGPLDAGEEVTVVFEWRLPAETGNEVQSDTAGFTVVFGLGEPSGGPPGQ